MNSKRNYDLDDTESESLADSGFEDEEPDQTQEQTPEQNDAEFGGQAA